METPVLRAPTPQELAELASLAARGAVFADEEEFREFADAVPWRIAVTDAGDALIVERWREHLDWLAMRAVWAAPRRMPGIVDAAKALARERGLGTLLSPLVPEELAGPYERAHMVPALKVIVMRRPLSADDVAASPPLRWHLAEAGPGDVAALLALDRLGFDPVWAYDRAIFERLLDRDRVIVASEAPGGPPIGYATACRTQREGVIGRLAVDPDRRGLGIGHALLAEALRGLRRCGAPYATLTTQADNIAAQRLYSRSGFKALRGALVGMTTSVEEEGLGERG
jgi:ribosomal protein S18 acetylase RimI-like enzyme